MMTLTPRRWPIVAIALIALMLAGAGIASAHAKLKSSVPAAGSSVATAPATVVAVFDNHDALQANGSLLKVTDASGAAVDKGDTALDKADADRKTLVVSLNDGLGNGTYTVAWTATSEGDGSKEEGSFTFTVGAASTSAPATLPATGAGDVGSLAALLVAAVAAVAAGALVRRRSAR